MEEGRVKGWDIELTSWNRYLDGDHYASVRAVEGIPVPSPHVVSFYLFILET